jgi:hypothetical protein
MSKDNLTPVGFELPERRERVRKHRRIAVAHLITTAALVVSILVAATAVSFGIARAGTLTANAAGDDSPFALAAFLLLVGIGGIAAFAAASRLRDPRRE